MSQFEKKRILIAGGGTGGHVYPALATVEALAGQGEFDFLYVGGTDGIEARIVPRYGLRMETLWISGFARSLSLKNLAFPFKLLSSLLKSRRILKKFRPHVAVGTGGYVTGPILFMAAKMRIPVLIQEQDVHPGVTTRLLARYADRICLAFEGAKAHFQQFAKKLVVTGNPIREAVARGDRRESLASLGLDDQRLTLFVFGGSQGSRAINLALAAVLGDLLDRYPLQVLWQTGASQYKEMLTTALFDGKRVKLLPYIDEMAGAYAASDIILCRAGASSLAELALVARSVILVPYPHAAGNHQVHNSRLMVDGGAALMVEEGENWEQDLRAALERLIEDEPLRRSQSAAWRKIARPDAAAHIAREIIALMN